MSGMTKIRMDISVIIVSYNTKKLLDDCLTSVTRSLKKSGLRWEIIVIDNGSNDGTRPMLAKKYPNVRTILNRTNAGFGKANNQGIKRATGEYILLLNSDTVTVNDAIGKLVAFGRQHPNSFIGPKLLNSDHTPQSSCGPFFTLPVVFAALFLRGDHFGLTRWSPGKARKVDWVSGACMLAPKKLFMQDLLFDEHIFMYMEEIDLLMRARRQGITTYFYPRSHIIHLGAASADNKKKGPVLNIYRGFLYLYKKHGTPEGLCMVRCMLRVKAAIAWSVGFALGNEPLKSTYAEAYSLV